MAKHLHKRFTNEQVRDIVGKFVTKQLRSKEACRYLGIGRTRLYQLVTQYKDNPERVDITYTRTTPTHTIAASIKDHILTELAVEKEKIIDNPAVPTNKYNYSYIQSLIAEKYTETVSLPTIIALAKANDYWKATRKKENKHTRVVLTNFVGELIQHDASDHLFAPDALQKWHLITSLDDYSRKLLSARLVLAETTFLHMKAVEDVCLRFGIPFSYYVDQHSIFRYVKDRDKLSIWTTYTKFTGDVDSQWAALLKELSVKPIYALSAPAKGKIERPYQWLQDHLVRTCVRLGVTDIAQGQKILDEEVRVYNSKRVHSTTGEIPDIRFNRALKTGQTLFRPFAVPAPFRSTRDIFALRDQRRTDGYRSISLHGKKLTVPKADPYMDIDVRLSPGKQHNTVEIRFWTNDIFLGIQTFPTTEIPSLRFT